MNHTAAARMRAPAQRKKRGLESVAFAPPAGHDLDLEVVELEGLLRRASLDVLRRPQRVEFQLLIAVVRGRCVHMIDFERYEAGPGGWLCIMPGQSRSSASMIDGRGGCWRFDPSSCFRRRPLGGPSAAPARRRSCRFRWRCAARPRPHRCTACDRCAMTRTSRRLGRRNRVCSGISCTRCWFGSSSLRGRTRRATIRCRITGTNVGGTSSSRIFATITTSLTTRGGLAFLKGPSPA
jgi:hypothetical protein